MHLFADILLPLPIPNLFTYEVPEDLKHRAFPFIRATVQFGKKKVYSGIIITTHTNKPKGYETKPLEDILDDKPVINPFQWDLWQWIASYYMCTPGEVMKAALPSGLRLESETNVFANPDFKDQAMLHEKETVLLEMIANNYMMRISEILRSISGFSVLPVLRNLQEKKAIFFEENIKEIYTPKTEEYVALLPDYQAEDRLNELLTDLGKAPKQMALIISYLSLSDFFNKKQLVVQKKILLKKAEAGVSSLKALVERQVFEIQKKEVSRLPENEQETQALYPLSQLQKESMDAIKAGFETHDVVLFHGVTSSGKTEVYIHLIKEQLDQGKQVLYLLPEIALTTQIINRLRRVFGDRVGVYHSKFSDAERVEAYKSLLNGSDETGQARYSLILGVRSSVFLPFANLGLIIVDEEHENTYKQYDPAPRYHARDVSIVLAKQHGARVILGTATPSVESYFNAKQKKYALVELFQRHKAIELPEIRLVNLREARRKKQMHSMFTPLLAETIQQALDHKEQVILFQNRRGFSPYLECELCGWVPQCEHCDVSLTYHKHVNSLVCHYCGYSLKNVSHCKACGNPGMQTRGFGTEKIADETALFFPGARVARMDLDTTRRKKAYETLIGDFEAHKIDILIGTQMLTKGLDFNNVRVVGILNADNMLHFPDFRAFERSYQLMTQVSGRAGRDKKRGVVIIQTGDPQHEIIQQVLEGNYKGMYLSQENDRKNFRYPPFYRIIRISLKHKKRDVLSRGAGALSESLRKSFGDRVIGPEYPPVSRIQQYYIKNILLKVERERSFAKAKQILREKMDMLVVLPEYKAMQFVVDVDPM